MCKHHWMLKSATKELWEQYGGTPARCKLCGEERVFRHKDLFGVDYRSKPHIQPSQLSSAQMPFDSQRSSGWKGNRL